MLCSSLLFCFRELNRPLKSLLEILEKFFVSKLETRSSKLGSQSLKIETQKKISRNSKTSRIENRVSSRDCQLTFERYCISTVLSRRDQSVCNQTCFWKFSSLRALNSIMAFILKSSGILPGNPSSSLIRCTIRAWIL